MLVEPVATTVAGAVVIAWLVVQAGPAVGDGVLVLWWLWLILAARLVWKVFEWRNEWFVATDKRLLLLYGLITHKVAMMPLTKVTDMNYGRSLVGRVLGYGQFLLESAGQDQALRQIDWVARPDRTYRLLCDTLFIPGGRPGGAPIGPGGGPGTSGGPLPATVPPPAP
ncbi:PH domain-containing protein, partial [Cellulosimicrobium cellulans]|nr:PH domain-containing protein [Cellulosimicrobium cellulans]